MKQFVFLQSLLLTAICQNVLIDVSGRFPNVSITLVIEIPLQCKTFMSLCLNTISSYGTELGAISSGSIDSRGEKEEATLEIFSLIFCSDVLNK